MKSYSIPEVYAFEPISISFIYLKKTGDFTDDVGNLQPGNRISCKTGGVKRSEKKQDKAGCRIKKLLEKQRAFCGFIQCSGVSGRTGAET